MTTNNEKTENPKLPNEDQKNRDVGNVLEPLLTTPDLERLLKVDRRTILRLIKHGQLPQPVKLGGSNRWRPIDILAAIDALDHRLGRKIVPPLTKKE
jgi:predicted DNA-binding transcriptional regulator AlpA